MSEAVFFCNQIELIQESCHREKVVKFKTSCIHSGRQDEATSADLQHETASEKHLLEDEEYDNVEYRLLRRVSC